MTRFFSRRKPRPTLFDELVAASARLLNAPVDWTVFAYYLGTLLAFYAGLWALAATLFPGLTARLGGMLLVAAALTLPVAGTCIFIADQHLHPRTLATALILLAAARLAPRAWGKPVAAGTMLQAALWMVAATLIHVQMAFYGLLFLGVLLLPPRALEGRLRLLAALVAGVAGASGGEQSARNGRRPHVRAPSTICCSGSGTSGWGPSRPFLYCGPWRDWRGGTGFPRPRPWRGGQRCLQPWDSWRDA